jgi:hypothetical protein
LGGAFLYNRGMKRLLLSLLAGFVIPFLYTVVTGPLSLYTHSERLNHLLWIPIGWPQILYYYLFPPFSSRAPHIADNTLFIIQIVCDVTLYGTLTYLLLLMRSLKKPETYNEPPPPTRWAK